MKINWLEIFITVGLITLVEFAFLAAWVWL